MQNFLSPDSILAEFKDILGKDYTRYRNHVWRVFQNCLQLDNNPEHTDIYAIAAVFHDIGIWTDHTFDYLKPSIAGVEKYLGQINRLECLREIALMIDMHHKWSPYHGQYADTVEIFRKADWIDVTLGLKTFGIEKWTLKAQLKQYPLEGFHPFLIKATIIHFLKHPLQNPLPMFKR